MGSKKLLLPFFISKKLRWGYQKNYPPPIQKKHGGGMPMQVQHHKSMHPVTHREVRPLTSARPPSAH